MMPLRWMAGWLSPQGRNGGLSILIFHRVLPSADPVFPDQVDAQDFDTVLKWVASMFTVLPLDEAVLKLQRGLLPKRSLAITFDDGYADNHTIAMPILQRHGMSATFFVASSFLDGGRMWNDTVIEALRAAPMETLDLNDLGLGTLLLRSMADRRQAIDRTLMGIKYLPQPERAKLVAEIALRVGVCLPDDLMMTSNQLRALRAGGMLVGGHTRTHPILAKLPAEDAWAEIVDGKRDLERILDEPLSLFAYPNGKPGRDYEARHREMVQRAGYTAAVSTSPGMARGGADVFQLPRFTPWDRTSLRFGFRMVDNMRLSGKVAS